MLNKATLLNLVAFFITMLIGNVKRYAILPPIMPDTNPIIQVSALNTLEISLLRAPKLLKIPISLVLSKTLI